MANELVLSLNASKETYTRCRKYIYKLFNNNKDLLTKVEKGKPNLIIPYIIKYIEMEESIRFTDILMYYAFYNPSLEYMDLVKVSLVQSFKKFEIGDKDFRPF